MAKDFDTFNDDNDDIDDIDDNDDIDSDEDIVNRASKAAEKKIEARRRLEILLEQKALNKLLDDDYDYD